MSIIQSSIIRVGKFQNRNNMNENDIISLSLAKDLNSWNTNTNSSVQKNAYQEHLSSGYETAALTHFDIAIHHFLF